MATRDASISTAVTDWPAPKAAPSEANGGSLVEINADGRLSEAVGGLNLPPSLEFTGNSACVVSLPDAIWVLEDVADPALGVSP